MPQSNIKQLITFRLHKLSNVSSRIAALRNERRFKLSLLESRIVALLGCIAPASLNRLALEASLDTSHTSRIVAELIDRGLIERKANKSDGRGIELALSPAGKSLYRRVLPYAEQRNVELFAVLTSDEKKILEEIIEKLTLHALEMLSAERSVTVHNKRKTPPNKK